MFEGDVGGYFGLELPSGRPPHAGSIALNSGRNGLRYLLLSRRPTKIYIPHFTCAGVARVVDDLGIEIERYSIDESMEPIFDFGSSFFLLPTHPALGVEASRTLFCARRRLGSRAIISYACGCAVRFSDDGQPSVGDISLSK